MSINALLQGIKKGDAIHDYKHAASIFVPNAFALHPHFPWSFYTRFTFSDSLSLLGQGDRRVIGALTRTASLPKFTVETKTLNAYNRPNLVHTKIKYDPVQIKIWDDGDNIMRKFWYDYYSFYFRDGDYTDSVYQASSKYQPRTTDQWGYTLRSDKGNSANNQLIQSVEIFSFHKKAFNSVKLINPVITTFQHGEHTMAGNELMEHSMTLMYETVTYNSGFVISGLFGSDMELYYDNNPSPLDGLGPLSITNLTDVDGVPTTTDSAVSQWSKGNTGKTSFGIAGTLGVLASPGFNPSSSTNLIGLAGGALGQTLNKALSGVNPLGPLSVPSIGSFIAKL
jgi:hypothetical protein